jgi:hypothetical protein
MIRQILTRAARVLALSVSALSLLLCAAAALDWARSYSAAGELVLGWTGGRPGDGSREGVVGTITSHRGRLEASAVRFTDHNSGLLDFYSDWGFGGLFGMAETYPLADLPAAESAFAVESIARDVVTANTGRGELRVLAVAGGGKVRVPHWLVAPVAGVPGFLAVRALRRRRRRARTGLCVHCGYDLRASEGRCPECGAPIPAPAAAAGAPDHGT